MASAINIPKSHLIMGLCLPLAVLLGYLLADPLDSGSLAVVVLVLSVLAVPLLMRWHHPLLVLSWNAQICPFFLPGHPDLWMLMAFVCLFFAVLNRSASAEHNFVYVPSVSLSLCFILAAVLVTAALTGGMGFRSLGSQTYGGRKYFAVIAAIVGYFGLTSRRIPARQAGLYLGLFLLPNLTSLVGNLAYAGGSRYYFLLNIFSRDAAFEQAREETAVGGSVVCYFGLIAASQGVYSYLLARYGVKGTFDPARPWRALLFALAAAGSLLTGFRVALVMLTMTFAFVFWLEGAWRTRLLPILLGGSVILGALALPHVREMPLAVQRTLSLVPRLQVDPVAQASAEASSDWRLEMWRAVLPEVPSHLLKGRGYAMDPNSLDFSLTANGPNAGMVSAMAAEDYHNGPLSVVMPFGLWGVAGLLWFWAASLRYLYQHYRHSDPALKHINTFLLGYFLMRVVFFIFVFGDFSGDLWAFAGVVGLAVSLNGAKAPEPAAAESLEEVVGEEMGESVY